MSNKQLTHVVGTFLIQAEGAFLNGAGTGSYPNFTNPALKIHKNTPKSVNHKRTYAGLRVFFIQITFVVPHRYIIYLT